MICKARYKAIFHIFGIASNFSDSIKRFLILDFRFFIRTPAATKELAPVFEGTGGRNFRGTRIENSARGRGRDMIESHATEKLGLSTPCLTHYSFYSYSLYSGLKSKRQPDTH